MWRYDAVSAQGNTCAEIAVELSKRAEELRTEFLLSSEGPSSVLWFGEAEQFLLLGLSALETAQRFFALAALKS